VAAAPETMDCLAEVRPLAREVALFLIRQELVGLSVGLGLDADRSATGSRLRFRQGGTPP